MPRTAGYSKRSLAEKPGLKAGLRVITLHAPPDYHKTIGRLPDGVIRAKRLSGFFDIIHLFAQSRKQLSLRYPGALQHLKQGGSLWISWPKKFLDLAGDLSEGILCKVLLPKGIVDVKVCAIDETWSGLKFVFRRKGLT